MRENFYDSIAYDFDSIMNKYDTNRRLEIVFNDFLGNEDLKNKKILDGGCGTGYFTQKAIERGATVTAIDISPKLIEITKEKNPKAEAIVSSVLELPFKDNTFDYVISSEVIEHTPEPYKATKELIRVLKPGGKICITVPNKSFWYFSMLLANLSGIRKYKGYENWVYYNKFRKTIISEGLEIIEYKGIHLFPFVINGLNRLLYKLDKIFEKRLGFFMVNIAVFAKKI